MDKLGLEGLAFKLVISIAMNLLTLLYASQANITGPSKQHIP